MGHASLIRLDADLVTSAGARCLDGSGGGFYWRAASSAQNATKLVVFLQGGGECRSATECAVWDGGAGRGSAGWPKTKRLGEDELSDDASVNPHFHDWNKLFVPYCSADMHSGTRLTPSHALGGGYFAGHNLINATLAQLRRSLPALAPSLVLLSGSSAGGIGVLLHADYFAAAWPAATVKAAPAAGFFYPAVSSERDFINGDATPARRLGPHARPAPPQLLRPAAPRGLTGVPPPHCRPRGRVGAVRLAALRRAVSGRGRNVHRPIADGSVTCPREVPQARPQSAPTPPLRGARSRRLSSCARTSTTRRSSQTAAATPAPPSPPTTPRTSASGAGG